MVVNGGDGDGDKMVMMMMMMMVLMAPTCDCGEMILPYCQLVGVSELLRVSTYLKYLALAR
jgi:hypothetical protein